MEKEDVISFTKAELAPTNGKKLNSMVLDVSMTHPHFQQFFVRLVLVDTGASSNIVYYQCFRDIGLGEEMLRPTSMKLKGFTIHKVQNKGIMVLNVTLGVGSLSRTEQIKFYVVDVQSIYNTIIGTLAQAAFDMVILVPHQRVKFLTHKGIRVELSNPKGILDYLVRNKKASIGVEDISSPIATMYEKGESRFRQTLLKEGWIILNHKNMKELWSIPYIQSRR